MNIRNRFHIAIFFLLTSVALWLILAFSQGFFLLSVPQAPNYCQNLVLLPKGSDAPEYLAGSSYRCIEYINTLEQLKSDHNLRMVERNRIIYYAVMGVAVALSLGIFYAVPRWRRKHYAFEHNPLGGALILGFILSLSPIILGMVLPSPSRWTPESINKYFESRRSEALAKLTELAIKLDTK